MHSAAKDSGVHDNAVLAKEQENQITEMFSQNDGDRREFTCVICKGSYTSICEIKNHLKEYQILSSSDTASTDTTTKKHNCEACKKTFSCAKYLKKHMEVHSTLELKCDICFMTFKRKDTLHVHKKRHIQRNESSHNFGEVGEIYNNRKELRSKIGEADENGKVTCPYCEKVFKKRKLLLAHIVIHGKFSFACETCGKSYKQRNCLNKHKLSHLTNTMALKRGRPNRRIKENVNSKTEHRCLICEKEFKTNDMLKQHEREHETLSVTANEENLTLDCTTKETF